MENIVLIVSTEKNLERLNKVTDDPAFIACLLKLKGLKEYPSGVVVKIGIRGGKDYEKKFGNTCENCGKPRSSFELD